MGRILTHEPMNFRRLPLGVRLLIVANVVVFMVSYFVGPRFYDIFGLIPEHVVSDRWIWQPFTYQFIHGGIMHLVFNLFALWMFGVPVEAQWEEWDFLKFYFLCGLGAAATQIAVAPHSPIPVIGASGAIYGVLVAFAMLYPDAVVYLYFFVPVKAAHMAILFGLIELFSGVSGVTPGIARFAHLGGMVTGYVYIRWWWLWKIKAKGIWRTIAERGLTLGPAGPSPKASRPRRRAVPTGEGAIQDEMAEVDRILDKILVSGLDSLTDEEKEIMRRYSERTKPH